MNIWKIVSKGILLLLCLAMLVQHTPASLSASAEGLTAYLKDIKLIYAKDLESAKEQVPEGYYLFKENINGGTDSLPVYICYSVTKDPSLAITDVRLMNEDGGFDRGTFNEKMDQALEALDQKAEGIYKAIVEEFIPNYTAKTPGAVFAYNQLNVFLYDEKTPLGEYFLSDDLTKQDIAKMLLVCHNTIITAVLSLLAQGLQRPDGKDWLDKLETMDPEAYEMDVALQKKYAELINQIQPALNHFSDQYNIMVYTEDVRDSMTPEQIEMYSEDLQNEETVEWWYTLWEILNSHMLAGSSGLSAESVLVEWYLGESVANHKVCMLIDAMTPGQRSLLTMIGPLNLIFNDLFTEEKRQEAEAGLKQLKDENGKVSLWDGVDMDIFTSEVGITSVAFDEMVTSNNYDIFTDEDYVLTKSAQDYISLVSNYSMLVSGALTVVSAAAMLAKGYQGSFILFKALSHLGVILTKSMLGTIFTYAPLVVMGLCLLATLIVWIVKTIQAGKPPEHDRTTIPKYMVDSVTDNSGAQRYEVYKRVDNVASDSQLKASKTLGLEGVKNLCGADVNACKGYRWAALYTSRNASVGHPIEASFVISNTFSTTPDGYIPVRHFNKKNEAINLNAVDEYISSDKALYLFYKSEKLSEDHRVYKYVRNISVATVSLTDPKNPDKFRFSTEEAIAVARKELTEIGMNVIDYNFSYDDNVVSLMGWNGTDDAANAIKDIRFVHRSSVGKSGSGRFGTITYGNVGNINDWSVFVSRGEQNPAPPVTMLKLVEKGDDPSAVAGLSICVNEREITLDTKDESANSIGWEAANEFTGGPAIPLGNLGAQLYFMPETPFTQGPDYLAGIEVDTYIYNYSYKKGTGNCDHTDIWDNDYNRYRAYKEKEQGELFYENVFQSGFQDMPSSVACESAHNYSENNPDCLYTTQKGFTSEERLAPRSANSVKYFLTKNPYRAIYGVASKTGPSKEMRNSFVNYDHYGYALCPMEATLSLANLEIRDVGYPKLLELEKEFRDKIVFLEDKEYHSEGIIVNLDITQTSFRFEYLDMNCTYVMGYTPDRTPLVVEDLMFSREILAESDYPDNFIQIPYMGGDGTQYAKMAPVEENVPVNERNYSNTMYAKICTPFYGYVRSERTQKNVTTSYLPGTGEYISALFLASKEHIRTSMMLSTDKDAECKDITCGQVEMQMVNQGATTTFGTNIGTDYYSGGNDNANTVLLGYARTDDPEAAIRDIRFHVCGKNEKPQETMDVEITRNGKTQIVRYVLVSDISLTSKANLECKKEKDGRGMEVWVEKELYEERQVYVYVTFNKTAFPEPITDIQINTWCSGGAYEPLLDFAGDSFYTVKKKSNVNLHIKNAWFEEGYSFFFKREGDEERYISQIEIKNGEDRLAVITELLEAGYSVVNKDMNQNAAGDHIYIGVKYTAQKDDAITNLVTMHKKQIYDSYSVTDEKHIYDLCAKVDLNKGAGGDYIYLYYTKDPRAGEPILELYGTGSVKDFSDALYTHTTVQRLWDFKYANMNAGTTFFTSDIYLVMKRTSSAGKYISDVYVAYGWSKAGAIEKLRQKGYNEYIDKDLNDGTGSSQYIYLGYKRTDDPAKAIRNIMLFTYGDGEKQTMEHEGYEYTLASNVNLNRHCNVYAADIFLYYSKDAALGDPITALYCSDTPVTGRRDEYGYHRTAKSAGYGTFLEGYCDLNKWALGDYIYLVMVAQPIPTLVASMFGNGSWAAIVGIGSVLLISMLLGTVLYRKPAWLTQARQRFKQMFVRKRRM